VEEEASIAFGGPKAVANGGEKRSIGSSEIESDENAWIGRKMGVGSIASSASGRKKSVVGRCDPRRKIGRTAHKIGTDGIANGNGDVRSVRGDVLCEVLLGVLLGSIEANSGARGSVATKRD
jgi:hypothetical protein